MNGPAAAKKSKTATKRVKPIKDEERNEEPKSQSKQAPEKPKAAPKPKAEPAKEKQSKKKQANAANGAKEEDDGDVSTIQTWNRFPLSILMRRAMMGNGTGS